MARMQTNLLFWHQHFFSCLFRKNNSFFFLFLTHQGSPPPPATMMLPIVTVPCVYAKSLQLCPTFCEPMDHSLPGSSVHGILQARILEWVAMPSSRDSSRPRDWTQVSFLLLHWQTGSLPLVPPGKPCHSTIYPKTWQFIIAFFFFYDTVWIILIHSLLVLPGIAATAITINPPKTQALKCACHYLCRILLTRARHKSSPDSSDDERHPTS